MFVGWEVFQAILRGCWVSIYNKLFYKPLETLYLQGPTFLGMWAGRPLTDICAAMTHTDSAVWRQNPEACWAEIERHIRAFVVLAETVLMVAFYMALVRSVIFLLKMYFYIKWQPRVVVPPQELLSAPPLALPPPPRGRLHSTPCAHLSSRPRFYSESSLIPS